MLAKMIDVHEAQAHLQELVLQVLEGNELTLTDGDRPVARLVPISPRVAGLHAGAIWISADFDAPLPDEFWVSAA